MIDELAPQTSQADPSSEHTGNREHKNTRRMSEEEHDAIFASWKAGLRGPTALGNRYGWSDETIRRLIKHGMPTRGWQPFAIRLSLEEAATRAAGAVATAKIADKIVDEWEKAKTNDLALINGNKGLLAQLITKFKAGMDSLTFDGMTSATACNNARALAAAVDTLVKAESLLMGKPTERQEIQPGDGWSKLTAEQLEFIVQNGKLPPDVPEDMIYGGN